MDEIELILNTDIKAFTSDQMSMVLKRLELLLSGTDGQPIKVQLIKLDTTTHSRRVILIFTVINGNTNKCLPGLTVVKQLKQKLKTDSSLITPEVISLETMVCQNECSNHGSCDQYSKRCLCEAFWMEDLFRYHLGDRESNCGKRPVPTKSRRYRKSNRNRYTLLEDGDDHFTGADRIELLANNNFKELNSRNAYLSADDDSLSDTLFANTNHNLLNNKLNSQSNELQKRHQKSLNGLISERKVRA
ncbi:unnamed protein product [Oppiella nova]|uniref:KIAA0319-like C-terminal domain-containing protein n=1 Tax=Oppiella nova TaxID=334625 RepID=A0A7R9LHM1_9ACAR|nr:unnamed protein product [Oppiella nova]CAG2163621.1 unnamed protein product [Oppiella nova]